MHEKLSELLEEVIAKGAQLEIHFFDKERDEAEEIIKSISGKLKRDWQEGESECGGTYWFETIPHDEDQIHAAVFYGNKIIDLSEAEPIQFKESAISFDDPEAFIEQVAKKVVEKIETNVNNAMRIQGFSKQ